MLFKLCAVAASVIAACCAPVGPAMPGAEARARSALDVLATVVDPAYQLAMQGCRDRLELTMREGERDAATPGATEAELTAINLRCDQVQRGFELIRRHHDEAVEAVEDGRYDDAAAQLDQVRNAWRELQTGGL